MLVREQEISQIWVELLGIPEADVDTDFFDLGGHSLLLMDLVRLFNQKLGIKTDVLTLLEHPTIAKFTTHWNSR
ncbi:acyl carrier protein [Actinophytocola glycyrrhizae]|uniref:Acyl carrier protein n=1 Tax=Actinophytocola glycyrrhizae TaxID=2044873 RepID=A0ABV9RUD1_9PSEU